MMKINNIEKCTLRVLEDHSLYSIELIKQMKNSIEYLNDVIFNDKSYMHLSYANHHDNGLTYTGNKRLIKIISYCSASLFYYYHSISNAISA